MKSEKARQSQGQAPSKLPYRTPTNAVVVVENNPIDANFEDLNQQIKSMMTMTNVKTANGHSHLATCNICGKQTASMNMPSHIEANHITGVSHPCNICGKTCRSRDALRMHKNAYHKTMLQD